MLHLRLRLSEGACAAPGTMYCCALWPEGIDGRRDGPTRLCRPTDAVLHLLAPLKCTQQRHALALAGFRQENAVQQIQRVC